MKRTSLLIAVAMATFTYILPAQTARETLTNTTIVELVRLGLSEALIVMKINQSNCRCDTTAAAITKLKAARVSDPIIMAMLNTSIVNHHESIKKNVLTGIAEPSPSMKTREESSEPALAGERALSQISEPGIYLFADGKMSVIEASVFSGGKANFLLGSLTYGIKKTKWRAKVRGRSANLKTTDPRPVFYFVFNPEYKNSGANMAGLFWGMPATSPNEFLMVQMDVKEASREAVMGEYGTFSGVSMGARDKDIREYSFEKIKTGIYKVTPKTNLAPGEYSFYYAGNVTGLGFAGGKVFDFSVSGQR